MRTRLRLLGHSVHPMLIVFPLGLLGMSVAFDIAGLVSRAPVWGVIAYWDIAAGLLMGVLAGAFGLIDLLGIPTGTRAARLGLVHGLANLFALGLFALGFVLRTTSPGILPTTGAFLLSVAGLAIAVVSGWLGGELVERLGVSVSDDANLDAPSSLRR